MQLSRFAVDDLDLIEGPTHYSAELLQLASGSEEVIVWVAVVNRPYRDVVSEYGVNSLRQDIGTERQDQGHFRSRCVTARRHLVGELRRSCLPVPCRGFSVKLIEQKP